jgi:predicted secreted protein
LFIALLIISTAGGGIFGQSVDQLGDVNGNSTIDIIDALLTAQYYVGLDPSNFNPAAADVDASGSVTIIDALLIAQYYVGLIIEFPGTSTDTINVQVDELFTIVLDENPSTGYEWFYTIDNPAVVVLESEVLTPVEEPVMPGSPYRHSFIFRALSEGRTRITFEHYREWEGPESKIDTKIYSIAVNDN